MIVSENINISNVITEDFAIGAITSSPQGQILPGYQIGNGTTIGNIDLRFEKGVTAPLTLAASASTTLTLSALTDDGGRTVAFVRVKKLLIWITAHTDGDFLTVGGAATHAWSAVPTFTVYDTALQVNNSTTGYVVASGSSDQLKITNSGSHNLTFIIALTGCSV